MLPRTFEYDDYPRDGERLLALLDGWRVRFPGFRANVFAIPSEMTDNAWASLLTRRDWLRVYPHGFRHRRGECREAGVWRGCLRELNSIATDDRWWWVFKAPWYGYSGEFVEELTARGFAVAFKSLAGFPDVIPSGWRGWCYRDADYAGALAGDLYRHLVAHPVYDGGGHGKARNSEISPRHAAKWSAGWLDSDRWAFVDELVGGVLCKVHLGCGEHVWPGWLNLDPREFAGVVAWDWTRQIPLGSNRADVVFSSHCLAYCDEERYVDAALDVWRVLRPGGVWRLSDDDGDSGYVWRRPGQDARGTGEIRSVCTFTKVVEALRRVGFELRHAAAGSTTSPHKDVLRGDSRSMRSRRGQKFYLEAVKCIEIKNLARDVPSDPRAVRFGRYRLPG